MEWVYIIASDSLPLAAARDAVAKAIYDRVFRWIVRQINQCLAPSATDMAHSSTEIGETGNAVLTSMDDWLMCKGWH